ncbi:K+-transporting ATPase ATPase A chain [Actinopolymorpha cephalotaxi]|uniref:Potassium-transporting ATPase potassium-binding subunit n=1 Tax=Actinopolymorpha cephalotaxi TaxID=504797 RepID=A0A1I2YLF1_9ACTN|nr:potassium-transporting ATPase subunit KdpA [Actinopolymorpha cephalotaxi]NYH86905.1 K+-transporting ATPase ATPase A chain [Actinopolymorpha cephalotaxi]SFH26380.1 K+-transporting ATPase ATPase A chain [Actinopolymorpha cephalotaxi]
MSPGLTAVLLVATLVAAYAVVHRPLGDYMARVYQSDRHLKVERLVYRAMRIDPDTDQRWTGYAASVLAFSFVSVLFLYAMQRLQAWLPLSVGMKPVPPDGAFNTAISFVTNTNWQWYSGESTMSYLTQMAGLTVQNFASAAVGMAVAVALIRGLVRRSTGDLGNFWVDLVRGTLRILLPIAFVAAIILLAGGVIQNFGDPTTVHTLAGSAQHLPGGAVASQEAIKDLGTNGGGPFNANSAHPFENPTGFTNLLIIFLLTVIPFSLPATFGRMVGNLRQGYTLVAVMGLIWLGFVVACYAAEFAHPGAALQLAGGAMEGKETRFGVSSSPVFAVSTTLTSTGSVNSMHDSFTAFGGGITILSMVLGEVAPGGVGSGLYGLLVLAVMSVFVAGLMVGRTPEYLGKKIRAREMKLVALYILATPLCVLIGTGLALALNTGRSSILNPGAHGLSEVLYAFASASNNNGSAFAGLTAGTPFYDVALGLCMLFGRFVPIVFVLALAGSLARQKPVPESAGTLRTNSPLFVGLLTGVTLIVTGLTFFPALALGPLAEGLS